MPTDHQHLVDDTGQAKQKPTIRKNVCEQVPEGVLSVSKSMICELVDRAAALQEG